MLLPQQSHQQDVRIQPQAVRVEGAGGHEDVPIHAGSHRPQWQDRGGWWGQRARPHCHV